MHQSLSSVRLVPWLFVLLLAHLVYVPVSMAAEIFRAVPFGATWKYLDNGTDQGAAWQSSSFNDSSWPAGPAQLGYGDGDESTVVGFGPDVNSKYTTTYFRHTFNVPAQVSFNNVTLRLIRDDGAVVYLNGVEVFRSNMPAGPIAYNSVSATSVGGLDESAIFQTPLANNALTTGPNVLAVEIHQWDGTSTDISFDLELTAEFEAPPGTAPSVIAQPASITVGLGDSATFNVGIFGSQPLQYQWRFNGNPIGGANSSTYAIPDATFNNAGSYDVRVSNPFGSIISQVATLNVIFLNRAQLTYEPMGPSTRRTGLVFSEIMYHPRDRTDGLELEFIEIFNTNPFSEDLSGYRISAEVDYTFPEGTRLGGRGFVVVAAKPADIEAVYGITGVLGPWSTNKLDNTSATLRLRKKSGAIVLETQYSDNPPWPVAADGAGHSLVLARPSLGGNSPAAWAASAVIGGSPGAPDPIPTDNLEHIVINEILTHTDLPQLDYVELFNASPLTISLANCILTDDPNVPRFRIPSGIQLGPRQSVAFDETQLGFALSADGETIYLLNPAETRVIDVVRFGGQANGVSSGRYPDGAQDWQSLAQPTQGLPNARPFVEDIVINEIMYHPISENDDDEYVELYNKGTGAVEVGGWKFSDGIDFTLPSNLVIGPGGYVVVARNAMRLLTNHPGLLSGIVVGDYGGELSNQGERLALSKPDTILETNDFTGVVVTNRFFILVDEVVYSDGGRWGKWSDGGGSSLELIDPRADNRQPSNWADSDESAKSSWTTVEKTDVMNLNHPAVASIDQLHFFLLDAGEALVDDIEFVYNGANRVTNPGFESGLTGWFFQGTQRPSFLETSQAFTGTRALHLVASARGTVADRVRTQLSLAPPVNSTATVRAKVRWLRGHPEIVFRAVGSSIEATAALPVPAHLGTPGGPNSRRVANAGPAITHVQHNPVMPRAGESIRVTAQAQDPNGVASLQLRYRVDPSTTVATATMNDNGSGGDALAGDGIYTGTIPAQNSGALVAFHVQASDGATPGVSAMFPADAPTRECLVRVGETVPSGDFGSYRFWMTQSTFNFWTSRETSSTEDVDVTFVYGNYRAVYNVGAHYGVSDNYSTILDNPTGTLCGYNLNFPSDDRLLGVAGVRLDWPVRDPTFQREHLMYWFLEQYGLPNNYRRYIHLFINGVKRGAIYEDTQRPNSDMLEEWYPEEADGELFKTDGWFESSPTGVFNAGVWLQPLMQAFNDSTGQKKQAYYRFNWKPRGSNTTANDYSSVFDMIDAANITGPAYESTLSQVIDMDNWMRTFAMNDLASFWDSFGNPNSKNAYVYKPRRSGWKVMSWDFDVGLGVFNDPVDAPLFGGGVDPVIVRMYNTPAFVRHYWTAIAEAVDRFFDPASVTPFLTERYAAFQDNGITAVSPFVPSGPYGLSVPGWIAQRRTFLLNQLATVAATFAVNGPDQVDATENLLTLTGTAPVRVETIAVNGKAYPVTWTTVTQWRLLIPLVPGINSLNIQGLDRLGVPMAGASRVITATYSGEAPAPENHLIITEILYDPLVPDAEFVEIHNTSATASFDLSGWRLNGVDYLFPPGSIITNGQFLVLAKNRKAFSAAYGFNLPVYDEYDGALDDGGETLTLLRPGLAPGDEIVVDRVSYDDNLPWPQIRGTGFSLQVVDENQDNSRVGNWSIAVVDEGWKQFRITTPSLAGTATALLFNLATAGDIYLDDVRLVLGSDPNVGPNLISNGDFETGVMTPWTSQGNHAGTVVTSDHAYSGNFSMKIVATGLGSTIDLVRQSVAGLIAGNSYTLSFRYLSTGPNRLRWRISAFFADFNVGIDVTPTPPILATPGTISSIAEVLPPFAPVWLNEVVPDNLTGQADNAGDRDPWIELFHAGGPQLNLAGYYLSDNYTNLDQWAFPAGAAIQGGQFKLVWADNEPQETTPTQWHTNFRLPPIAGSVALSRMVNDRLQIVDYLDYQGVGTDQGQGSFPDGNPFFRRLLYFVTPGGANDDTFPPAPLFFNEWMASNTGSVLDPADSDPDDWFEIYNAGDAPVDLAGYRITDTEDNPTKYVIPQDYVLPGHGYLVVWADEEGSQTVSSGQLHVNFRLGASGETLSLYDPRGRLVDTVTFLGQTANISQGRIPDGGEAPFVPMPVYTPGAPNQGPAPIALVMQGIQVNRAANEVTLHWNAEPGRIYRVQFKTALEEEIWQTVPGGAGVSGGMHIDRTAPAPQQRFYRIVRLP